MENKPSGKDTKTYGKGRIIAVIVVAIITIGVFSLPMIYGILLKTDSEYRNYVIKSQEERAATQSGSATAGGN